MYNLEYKVALDGIVMSRKSWHVDEGQHVHRSTMAGHCVGQVNAGTV